MGGPPTPTRTGPGPGQPRDHGGLARDGAVVGLAVRPDGVPAAFRPDPGDLPRGATTRFAPAPTGYLHLGHLVNALFTWGIARATGGRVILRIEDHDRQRSRADYERALLDDLERLGLAPDEPAIEELRAGASPYRQSDVPHRYEAALEALRATGRAYACDCARSTFAAWAAEHGGPWRGPGCPGGCRHRALSPGADAGIRVALDGGTEAWIDLLAGPCEDQVAPTGDLLVRDRHGNWTYGFCVVVDDLHQGIDLVIRGRDLLHATPAQVRLARLLGRRRPPAFLHHPLIHKASGAKLSKADGDTAVRALLGAGWSPAALFGLTASLVRLQADPAPIGPSGLGTLFA